MKKIKNTTHLNTSWVKKGREKIDLSSDLRLEDYLYNLKKFYSKDKETMSYTFNFLNLVSLSYLKNKKLVLKNLPRINSLMKDLSIRYAKNTEWFNNDSVAIIYWLRHIDKDSNVDANSIIKTLNKRVEDGWFSLFSLSQAVAWVQNLHDLDSVSNFLDILSFLILNWKITANDFIDDIVQMVRILSISWLDIPENLQKIYESWKSKYEWSLQSPAEEYFYKSLKNKWVDFDSNIYFDWIEMDFFLKEKDLNIEIDWYHHWTFEKKISDKKRDDYLLSKWIKTLRITTTAGINEILNSNVF